MTHCLVRFNLDGTDLGESRTGIGQIFWLDVWKGVDERGDADT